MSDEGVIGRERERQRENNRVRIEYNISTGLHIFAHVASKILSTLKDPNLNLQYIEARKMFY